MIKTQTRVRCKPEDFRCPVIGTVTHIYENSALVAIEDFDKRDTIKALRYENKVVVRFRDMLEVEPKSRKK